MNARNLEALCVLAEERLSIFEKRSEMLGRLLEQNEEAKVRVSEKTRAFWQLKKTATENFVQVFRDAQKSEAELSEESKQKRQEYFAVANALWAGLKDVLLALHNAMIGPYTLGSSRHPLRLLADTPECYDYCGIND